MVAHSWLMDCLEAGVASGGMHEVGVAETNF